HAFWLDGSRPGARARFSLIGDARGPPAEGNTYDHRVDESIFDYLARRTEELRPAELPDPPFEFDCGFVGYLGYELKAECGYGPGDPSDDPAAAFLLTARRVAFAHE